MLNKKNKLRVMMFLSVLLLGYGFIMLKHAKLSDKLNADLNTYNEEVLSPENMKIEYSSLECSGLVNMSCEIKKLRFTNLVGIENIETVKFSENTVMGEDMDKTIENLLHYMMMR